MTGKRERRRRTKIICTLGTASDKVTVLSKMMMAGMDVARLNFSHGSISSHLEKVKLIRELNKKNKRDVKILGDLEGHRIRLGSLKDGRFIRVRKNNIVWLTNEDIVGEGFLIPFDYMGSLRKLTKGTHIFIDDGNIALVVESSTKTKVKTKVVVGGRIKERKGVNIPDVSLDFKGLAERDKLNIDFCIRHKICYLAQSFVRKKEDILALRKYLKDAPHQPKIIAKIEDREGIENIEDIMDISDGIMIARGDMGISIPIYEVPFVQKKIIKQCRWADRLSVTATQMLESMTENHIPTRAEVSDVANAILDGSDYIMLSAETAVGKFPVGCVKMMDKIIKYTEKNG